MVHDQDDSVNQSLSFSIFLKSISILFILFPLIKNSFLDMSSNLMSFSPRLNIFDIGEKKVELNSILDNEYLVKGKKLNKIDILFKKIEKNND